MTEREKTINGLEDVATWMKKSVHNHSMDEMRITVQMLCKVDDVIEMLKAQNQEPEIERPKPIELEDETKRWLEGMTASENLQNIADILIDWDGYRTRDGLASLINEVWAYARYAAAISSPRLITEDDFKNNPALDTDGCLPAFCESVNRPIGWMAIHKGYINGRRDLRYWTSIPSARQMKETPWSEGE